MKHFFSELKRRNVYKVAIAYGVVAWLLLQAASILFPTFEAPSWTMKVFVAVVALGFPIALIIAWAFELTPEGLKRTEFADELPKKSARNRAWIYVVVIAGAISLGLVFLGRYTAPTKLSGSANAAAKSIAVLPFENLSEDKANAYFADGIQEEILTRLAKIADLKVISRTSTQQYQSKPGNLSEIAKQLGVANILEGSVQKAGDSVRVSVNLIQAASDSHLWADTYDRKLTDIFGVESEIAKAIAEQLQAKLTGREQQALAVKPTNNSEAYDAYLRGLAFEARVGSMVPNLERAAGFYARSVQLDPAFALAWGRLARAESFLYFNGLTVGPEAATRALKVAQELQPNSPETILAQGYYQYYVLRDYELAKATFVLVRDVLPGSSDVPAALAWIARRQGRWDESIDYWEQALALDPRNSRWLADWAQTYSMLRQFPAALKMNDRALDIEPNDPDLIAAKAGIHQAEGDLEQAGKLLAGVDAHAASFRAFVTKTTQLRLERNYVEAVRLLQGRQAQLQFGSEFEKGLNQWRLAVAQRLAGDSAGAKITAEQTRNTLEPVCKNQPDNARCAALLSQAYAALGDKNSALKEAKHAIALWPSAKDSLTWPLLEENLALVEVMVGEPSQAISTIARLLQIPYSSFHYNQTTPVTPALLRLDPVWDPLRGDPRFQKLCEEKRP